MRGASAAVSLIAHLGVVAAVILGTAKTARSTPAPVSIVVPFFQPTTAEQHGSGPRLPGAPRPDLDLSRIPLPSPVQGNAPVHAILPVEGVHSGSAAADSALAFLLQRGPEVLTGPLPIYPEALRQAGVQGRVVLEATVDTRGRVEPASVTIVSATRPEFVAPSRQALLATLFRPAEVGGHPVRMRVRVPFEFALRSGSDGVQ